MPYRRRRGPPRRKAYRRASAPPAAVRRYVDRRLGRAIETKSNTVSASGVTVTSAGAITGLLVPAQGASSAQRNGDAVKPSGGVLNLAYKNGTGSLGAQYLRLMVVQTKPGEAAPGLSAFPNFIDPVTMDQRTKYRVLYDKILAVNPTDSSGSSQKLHFHQIRFKTPYKGKWDPASTTGVAPDDGGAITFYRTSDIGASGPITTWTSEVYYKDC